VLGSKACAYKVSAVKKDHSTKNTATLRQSKTESNSDCFQISLRSILQYCIASLRLSGGVQDRGDCVLSSLIKSLLLAAPPGGGKTRLLHRVAGALSSTLACDGEELVVVSCSCTKLSSRAAATDIVHNSSHDGWHMGGGKESATILVALLNDCLQMFDISDSVKQQALSVVRGKCNGVIAPPLLLVIDDMEALFKLYPGSSMEEDTSGGGGGDGNASALRSCGFCISKLLSYLAVVEHSSERLFVLGATSFSPSQLPRAHTGCPEYEKCVELPSPTYSDRVSLLSGMLREEGVLLGEVSRAAATAGDAQVGLTALGKQVQGGDRETERGRRLSQWADQLAGLTAGFLPGDLQLVIRRMQLLHQGKLAAGSHGFANTSAAVAVAAAEALSSTAEAGMGTGTVMAWSTALDAVSAIVPRQLRDLGLGGSSSMGTSGHERLGWRDFAGYPEIVRDLQRRLSHFQESRENGAEEELADSGTERAGKEGPDISGGMIMREGTQNENVVSQQPPLFFKPVPMRGMVIHGPSGCGKTLLASVVTSEVGEDNV
jgi:DNA polymerase III delta prime subunit